MASFFERSLFHFATKILFHVCIKKYKFIHNENYSSKSSNNQTIINLLYSYFFQFYFILKPKNFLDDGRSPSWNFPQLSAPRNISSLLFPACISRSKFLSLFLSFCIHAQVEAGFAVDPVAVFCVATAVKCVIARNLRRVSEFTRWPPQ